MLDCAAIQLYNQSIGVSNWLECDSLEFRREFLARWRFPSDNFEVDITHPYSAARKIAEVLEVPSLRQAQSVAEELEQHLRLA